MSKYQTIFDSGMKSLETSFDKYSDPVLLCPVFLFWRDIKLLHRHHIRSLRERWNQKTIFEDASHQRVDCEGDLGKVRASLSFIHSIKPRVGNNEKLSIFRHIILLRHIGDMNRDCIAAVNSPPPTYCTAAAGGLARGRRANSINSLNFTLAATLLFCAKHFVSHVYQVSKFPGRRYRLHARYKLNWN